MFFAREMPLNKLFDLKTKGGIARLPDTRALLPQQPHQKPESNPKSTGEKYAHHPRLTRTQHRPFPYTLYEWVRSLEGGDGGDTDAGHVVQ